MAGGWWLANEIIHSPFERIIKDSLKNVSIVFKLEINNFNGRLLFARPTTTISFGNWCVWVDSSNRFESRQCIIVNGGSVSARFALLIPLVCSCEQACC